ncbi:MAG: hypothetical protein AAGA40_02350, partial [Cyanobacteria bacterium P01_E01_bin.45]
MSIHPTGNPNAESSQHGGRRSGAGRPKGTGSRFSEPTIVKRIPVSKVADVDRLISSSRLIS